jgi:tetratricopeptide (TPR) repeat protein
VKKNIFYRIQLPPKMPDAVPEWIEQYRKLMETVEDCFDEGNLTAAIECLQKASTLAFANQDWLELGISLNLLGLAQEQNGQPLQAKVTLAQSVEAFQKTEAAAELGNTHNNLGFVESNLGNLELAKQHHQMALSILEKAQAPTELRRSYYSLGIVCKDLGELTLAKANLEKALLYFDDEDLQDLGHTHIGLGLVQELLNQVEDSKKHYYLALKAYQAVSDFENEAVTLHNLGQLEDNQYNFLEALVYYFRALEINLIAPRTNRLLGVASDLSSLASLIYAIQSIQENQQPQQFPISIEDILKPFLQSLKQVASESNGQSPNPELVWVIDLPEDNSKNLALKFREYAAQIYRKIGHYQGEIFLLTDMAIVERNDKNFLAAKRYLERVLELSQALASPREQYEAHLNLGEVYLMAEDFTEAIKSYEAATSVAESLRFLLLLEEEGISYFNDFNLIAFHRLARLYAHFNPILGLEELEKMKGREFLRQLRWGEILQTQQIPQDLLDQEIAIFNQLRQILEQLGSQAEPEIIIAYQQAEAEMQELWLVMEDTDPEYVGLRQGRPLTWQGLKSCLIY